jgi:spore germination protein Q
MSSFSYRIGSTPPYNYPTYQQATGGAMAPKLPSSPPPALYGGSMGVMPSPAAAPLQVPAGTPIYGGAPAPSTASQTPGLLPLEQSFIENILRLNLGRIATIYMTFENNSQWNAKIFKGKIEAAGRDHIIISDPITGMRTLLLMVNLDYITFDEELQYSYSY